MKITIKIKFNKKIHLKHTTNLKKTKKNKIKNKIKIKYIII